MLAERMLPFMKRDFSVNGVWSYWVGARRGTELGLKCVFACRAAGVECVLVEITKLGYQL